MSYALILLFVLLPITTFSRSIDYEFVVDGKKVICTISTVADCRDQSGNQVQPPEEAVKISRGERTLSKQELAKKCDGVRTKALKHPEPLICERKRLKPNHKYYIPEPNEKYFRANLPEHFKTASESTDKKYAEVVMSSLKALKNSVDIFDSFLDKACIENKKISMSSIPKVQEGSFAELAVVLKEYRLKAEAYYNYLEQNIDKIMDDHSKMGDEIRKRFFYAGLKVPSPQESSFGKEFDRNWGRRPDIFNRRIKLVRNDFDEYYDFADDLKDLEKYAQECDNIMK
ncbi:MAG: hypothetical protein M9962_12725 [Oligoflexia bacterium]|nr:hypothetical protein [Oligoflexia bacterium]